MNSNMMMMMQSAHRDVLEASPDTDESKAKLVEELQSRGRAAVGAKSWMDAKMLYEKALTLSVADSAKVAILNANLSLVQKSMGNFEPARQAALAATTADPSYVKGWWRLGQALQQLHRHQEALDAYTKAKELEPTNKALIKEHQRAQQKVEEEAILMKEQTEQQQGQQQQQQQQKSAMDVDSPTKTTTTTTTTKSSTTNKSTTTVKKESSTSTTNTSNMKMDGEDENIFTKSDAVRGYKVVNGKKTSYFHNELSEEAKNLIGDIAPKKLETVPTPQQSSTTPATANGASAWNQAGTWEEKDVTKWAKTTLEEHILQTTYTLPDSSPAPGALVTVSKVKTLDGHASFALARGKKRYIYEFMVKLEWALSGNDLVCSGSLALPDIDGTIDLGEGYEMHDFNIDSVSDNSVRPLIERFVQRGGFHEQLNENIDDWVRRFKKEF